jgi:hypothetical protein
LSIIEQELMGALPFDEELPPPPNENGLPHVFDFFGLGQPGQTTFQPPQVQVNEVVNHVELVHEINPNPDAAPTANVGNVVVLD